jgi:hypothetical protein
MNRLHKRIEQLENRARVAPSELDRRLEQQFERDAAKFGPAWVKDVEEASERFGRAFEAAKAAGRDPVTDRAVQLAGEEFMEVRHENRPAWPPELRKIYLEDPEAQPLHDCADCGLSIPCRPGRNTHGPNGPIAVIRPFYRYFDSCPACGGRVGYGAHYLAQHEASGAS